MSEQFKKPKVAILCCAMDMVSWVFMERSWNPLWYQGQPDFDKYLSVMRGSTSVAQKRNMMIEHALQDPLVTHIFMLDNDVIYEDANGDINTAIRFMLNLDMPILSGALRVRGHGFPMMIYQYIDEKQGFKPLPHKLFKDRTKLIEVDGTGMGFILIKREVFEHVEKPWYLEDKFTEDFYFCLKAKKAGYPVYITNDLRLSHLSLLKIRWDGTVTGLEE